MRPRSRSVNLTRHPLTVAVVGFVLTGIIGAGFTWWLESASKAREGEREQRQKALELEAASRARAIEAVREVTDLVHERTPRKTRHTRLMKF
jgi:Na+/glutamate symporter